VDSSGDETRYNVLISPEPTGRVSRVEDRVDGQEDLWTLDGEWLHRDLAAAIRSVHISTVLSTVTADIEIRKEQ